MASNNYPYLPWWLPQPFHLSSQQPSLDLLDFSTSPALPPSPSDTSSSSGSCDTPITRPRSAPVHVVCNAPLVAPVPLPYHSPTFLQFDLPDIDEDLSHPPYIKKASKRKREADEQPPTVPPAKRPFLTCTQTIPLSPSTSRRTVHHQGPHTRHRNSRSLQRHF